ncbi:hypothetical protein CCHR01_14402 [Colletotrichum chrysophilum]|uniref:Uncharacterized protein n=1 Tax=Colletotrichum chrysophilum TaxID=1836956 RepID=A0AAD9A7K4_9PEZI|nr:hypothetical protein CCHR01_14402 [Colletotrichum chrysophilum]
MMITGAGQALWLRPGLLTGIDEIGRPHLSAALNPEGMGTGTSSVQRPNQRGGISRGEKGMPGDAGPVNKDSWSTVIAAGPWSLDKSRQGWFGLRGQRRTARPAIQPSSPRVMSLWCGECLVGKHVKVVEQGQEQGAQTGGKCMGVSCIVVVVVFSFRTDDGQNEVDDRGKG